MTTRALLFTDVVDSTSLVERLGDTVAAERWAEHDRRARRLLLEHRGIEIDRSDGLFALFESTDDAARYALAYHDALRDIGLSARAGLHHGRVALRENTALDVEHGAKRLEVEGLAKPLAARVMSLACGGQTLVSEAAKAALEAVDASWPDGVEIVSHGHYRLKGIANPIEIFECGWRGRSAFAPPTDSEKAYRVVRVAVDEGDSIDAVDRWRPVRDIPHTLPAERDRFVGRAQELRAIADRLDAGARLLTLLGPGGTGKTRLVVRYGHAWLGDWPGGVCFCDLSEARTADGIFSAVAVALGVPLVQDDASVQLGHAIATRGRCLVIVDNVEQIVEPVARALGAWLDLCPQARFVATSRERLRIAGEDVMPIEPLPLAQEAIELFAVRAGGHRPDFAIDDANRASVAEVVRLLDGLPLAIELAAARVRVLSPAMLVERMRDRFRLLVGARGGALRQATLRAAIDWSWDLLDARERAALTLCSVFEGPFTLHAAEAMLEPVDASEALDVVDPLDLLQSLVDKSLVRLVDGVAAKEPRFGFLVSIQEYARERLGDVRAEADRRHGRHFASYGTDDAIDALRSHDGLRRLSELSDSLDDIVSACKRAIQRGDARVAAATFRAAAEVFEQRGPLSVAAALGADVLALPLDVAHRALVSVRYASALDQLGANARARACLEAVLPSCRDAGLRRVEGIVTTQLALLDRRRGDNAEQRARSALQHALELARETGDRIGEGAALMYLGNVESDLGLLDDARTSLRAALAIHRSLGDRRAEAFALGALGARHLDRGELDEARGYFEDALAIHRAVGHRRSASTELLNLGTLNFRQGRIDDAEACYLEALANDRAVGARAHEAMVLTTLVLVHDARGRADDALACCEEALAIAREVGKPMSISYALTNLAGLHTAAGRIAEARRALTEAEPLQRGGGPLQLGKFLCIRSVADHAAGDTTAAEQALAEAEAIAVQVGAGPQSGLRTAIDESRAAMRASSTMTR